MTALALKRVALLAAGAALVFMVCYDSFQSQLLLDVEGQGRARMELAATAAEQKQGLSGRESLRPASGMLFTLPNAAQNCFWMKDMRFAIDIIWTDAEKRVLTVKDNVTPDTYPESYCSPAASPYVIELAAGQARAFGIEPGSQLSW